MDSLPHPELAKLAWLAFEMTAASAMGNVATGIITSYFERRLSHTRKFILSVLWLVAVFGISAAVVYERIDLGIVLIAVSSLMPLLLSQRQIIVPTDPHIVAGGAELHYWDNEQTWAFAVNCTISPTEGNSILLCGSNCHVQVLPPHGASHNPLTISLLNIRKNDAPPLPQARIDAAAGVLLICRHHDLPWTPPIPDRLLARIVLQGEERKTVYTMTILLVRNGLASWNGHGEALDSEIKEFLS